MVGKLHVYGEAWKKRLFTFLRVIANNPIWPAISGHLSLLSLVNTCSSNVSANGIFDCNSVLKSFMYKIQKK